MTPKQKHVTFDLETLVEVEENKHDALSDCIYQARYISAMLRKLYKI